MSALAIGLLLIIVVLASMFSLLRLRRRYRRLEYEAHAVSSQLAGYKQAEDTRIVQYREKIRALQAVIEERALRILFQPIVDVRSGQVVGAEALARFSDGRSPSYWFEEASRAGIRKELEMAAINRTLAMLTELGAEPDVYINVSPETISSGEFSSLLLSPEVPCGRLVVELTEHAVIDDYEIVKDVVDKIKMLGVRLAVDDVGAGYSTLRHVLQLRPDIVKLDRSLIAGVDRDPVSIRVISTLTDLATHLHAEVIAEGIETHNEADAVWSVGVGLAQGYLFARPQAPPLPSSIAAHSRQATSAEEEDAGVEQLRERKL